MQFSAVAKVFLEIENTPLRNTKTTLLADLLKSLPPADLPPAVYLSLGRVAPLYEPIEFGLAEKNLLRSAAYALNKPIDTVTKSYQHLGDLGNLLETALPKKDSRLDITAVFQELVTLAKDSGAGSTERKIQRLGNLLKKLDPLSAKYLIRLVAGKTRLGFSDVTILDALSTATTGGKTDRPLLEHAYNVSADLGRVASLYLQDGQAALRNLGAIPGVPIRPARAERLGTVPEIFEKLGSFAVEPKFDGMRVQVHAFKAAPVKPADKVQADLFAEAKSKSGVAVKIYSRGLEDITPMFPDIVEAARSLHESAGDFIVDGEAVGVTKTGQFLAFQETVKRKRKHNVAETTSSIPLHVYVFDVLYAQNKTQLSEPYTARRLVLEKLLAQKADLFRLTPSTVVKDAASADKLFRTYIQDGLEGILCKRLDSVYQAGARNFNWVKYKRAHEEALADTLDCVVMGYYRGRGKRQSFGIGAFLVGVLDGENIQTVAKVGTGLTDEEFRSLHQNLHGAETDTPDPRYQVAKSLTPDLWVKPNVVVEIQADEITKSPLHTTGYALRFPRLIRFRTDKKLADITTIKEVISLYNAQKK